MTLIAKWEFPHYVVQRQLGTLNDVVTDVLFTITVSDGTNSVDYENETPVPPPTDPTKFTAISAATADDRLAWALAAMDGADANPNQAWFLTDAEIAFNSRFAPVLVMAPAPT